jgi:hypothetical protein
MIRPSYGVLSRPQNRGDRARFAPTIDDCNDEQRHLVWSHLAYRPAALAIGLRCCNPTLPIVSAKAITAKSNASA